MLGGVAISPTLGTTLPEQGQPTPARTRTPNQVAAVISIPLFTGAAKEAKLATAAKGISGTPNAMLRYNVLRASNRQVIRSGTAAVSAFPYQWNQLSLDVTITENEPVLVEVFAINNDLGTATYFDDLTINYTPGPVIEENHFYAYGQRLDGLSWRRTDERSYGRGYQGQNTTQDAESGYTAFDLRMYDAHYGRWLMNDPMRQHFSGYSSMGNNPVSHIDPDGGYDLPEVEVVYKRPNGFYGGPAIWYGNSMGGVGAGFNAGYKYEIDDYNSFNWNVTGFRGEYKNITSYSAFNTKYGDFYIPYSGEYSIKAVGHKQSVEVKSGNEYLSAGAKLEGQVFMAEASLNGGVYLGQNGKWGAALGGDAGAYVLKGDVSTTINILGLKVKYAVTESAMSAHIGAGANFLYDSKEDGFDMSGRFNAGFGLGGGLKFQITNYTHEFK